MIDLVTEIRVLESKGVYIRLDHDHYKDGSNCNWAIEIIDVDTRIRKHHTSWFGDNHEFGDTIDCYIAAFRFAKWLLQGDNAQWYFASQSSTTSEEAHSRWIKIQEYRKIGHKILYNIEEN